MNAPSPPPIMPSLIRAPLIWPDAKSAGGLVMVVDAQP
jgi:hypothetical protein